MKLTPTQQRIWDLLKDGKFHHRDEIQPCLDDQHNMNPDSAVFACVSRMRKNIENHGYGIVTSGSRYRLVKFISENDVKVELNGTIS